MANYKLSKLARQDIASIWTYLSDNSGEAKANKVLQTLTKKFEMLAANPGAGRPRDEVQEGIRSYPVKPYVIFYDVITDSRIVVGRVLHQSRNLSDIF